MSNIGAHLRLHGHNESLGNVRAIVGVDLDVAAWMKLARDYPDSELVVRTCYREQPLSNPLAEADAWFERHLPLIAALAGRRAIYQGYNEIADDNLTRHLAFEGRRAMLLHKAKERCGWLAQSAGTPREDLWAAIRGAIDAHWVDGDVLLLHEYCSDAGDLRNPWHIMRRTLPAVQPYVRGLKTIIAEWGIDYMPDTRKGTQGWRRSLSANQIVDLTKRARDLYAEDEDVIAFCPYTLGALDEWEAFGFGDVWPDIRQLMYSGEPPVGAPPIPVVTLPIPGARISQQFGENPVYYAQYGLKGHNGIDLSVPTGQAHLDWHGTPVYATGPGRAIVTRSDGYGLYVYTLGPDVDRLYAHLASVEVRNNEDIHLGQVIGRVGYTGNCVPEGVLGTHLHYGVRPNDPYNLKNGYSGYCDPFLRS